MPALPWRSSSTSSIGIGRCRRAHRWRTGGSCASHLHPHNIGRPNAAKHLDEALRYILGHDGVWATTADDIAEYYLANYYDQVKSWIAERNAQTAS